MSIVTQLEESLVKLYQKLPHLPSNIRTWIGTNIWWITLIGVVLGALGVVSSLFALLFAAGWVAPYVHMYGQYGVGALAGAAIAWGVVWALVGATVVVVSAMAIQPLRDKLKKGWNLLFVVLLIQGASIVLEFLFNLGFWSFVGLFWSALWLAAAGYVLFELRSQFAEKKSKNAKR